jgi:hypothetical protein
VAAVAWACSSLETEDERAGANLEDTQSLPHRGTLVEHNSVFEFFIRASNTGGLSPRHGAIRPAMMG